MKSSKQSNSLTCGHWHWAKNKRNFQNVKGNFLFEKSNLSRADLSNFKCSWEITSLIFLSVTFLVLSWSYDLALNIVQYVIYHFIWNLVFLHYVRSMDEGLCPKCSWEDHMFLEHAIHALKFLQLWKEMGVRVYEQNGGGQSKR